MIKKIGNSYSVKVKDQGVNNTLKTLEDIERKRFSQPEDSKTSVDFGYFDESVQISENHTDTVRVRAIYS
jgi:hypothetical protein